MNLVEDHQLVLVSKKVKGRIGELVAIGRILKVEIDRRDGICYAQGKCRLPNLPGPKQNHSGVRFEVRADSSLETSRQYPCIFNVPF